MAEPKKAQIDFACAGFHEAAEVVLAEIDRLDTSTEQYSDDFLYLYTTFADTTFDAARAEVALVELKRRHGKLTKSAKFNSAIGVTIGAIIMVVGYTLGKTFVYSTFEYAMIKLPYEIAQGALGAVLGWILCWNAGIEKIYKKYALNY